MTFYERIVKETESDKNRFFSRAILSTVLEKGISKELYRDYLVQAYHHVRFTCPLFRHAITKMHEPNDTAFIHAFNEYIQEEEGHEEWILNDIQNMGGDKEKIRATEGDLAVKAMISYMYQTIDNVSPYALLGMVYVLEGTSVNVATEAAEAIAKRLKIDTKKGFSYLLSHGKLDLSHVDFYINLVNQIKNSVIQNEIIKTAKMIYFLWGIMFDELENNHKAKTSIAA